MIGKRVIIEGIVNDAWDGGWLEVGGSRHSRMLIHESEGQELPKVSHEALVELLTRAREELRLIRIKDCGAVYDSTLRIEIDIVLSNI